MLRQLVIKLNVSVPYRFEVLSRFASTISEILEKPLEILDKCDEDTSHIAPYLRPTFNFAAYANKSPTLQELVKLGVNLHKIEKIKDAAQFILGLDFEKNIKKYIIFFHDLNVTIDDIAQIFTKNPFILRADLDDLLVRINYLQSKRFTNEMITRIVSRNPFWLSFSTQEIDEHLGFFQKEFGLAGREVRELAAKQPKLITYDRKSVKVNTFVLKEEMGFNQDETKSMLLNKPNLFMKSQEFILKSFEYVHKIMEIPTETICKIPEVLTTRQFRIQQRHLFLVKLGKAQYNPKQPNYVSLMSLISGSDSEFSTEIAKSSVQAFNTFLKSL